VRENAVSELSVVTSPRPQAKRFSPSLILFSPCAALSHFALPRSLKKSQLRRVPLPRDELKGDPLVILLHKEAAGVAIEVKSSRKEHQTKREGCTCTCGSSCF